MLEKIGIKIDRYENIYLILLIFLVFATKGILAITILPLLYLLKKEENKFIVLEFLEKAAILKFVVSIIYQYGNMRTESIRLIILFFFIHLFIKKDFKNLMKDKISVILSSLFGLGLIWSIFSPGKLESLKLFKKENIYLLLPMIFLYLLKDNRKFIEFLKNVMLLVVVSIFMQILLKNFNYYYLYLIKGNVISIFSVMMPYIFFEIFKEKKNILRIIYLLIFLLGVFIVIKSGARGALGAIILSISFCIVLLFRWKGIVGAFSIIVLSFILVKMNPKIENQFLKAKDFSTRSRYYLITAGLYTFKNNVIFGSGRGNTQKYFIEYSNSKEIDYKKILKNNWEEDTVKKYYLRYFPDTHNIFIDFLAEYGILGIIFIVVLGIYIPLEILKLYFKTKNMKYISMLAGLSGFLLAGMSWSLWTRHGMGVPFFIVLIYLFITERGRDESDNTCRGNRE